MAPQQQVCKLGKSIILVHSDEFETGYGNGFIASPRELPHPLTDSVIYEIIASNLVDVRETDVWNAGYIVGVIAGLFKGDPKETEQHTTQEVQLGAITLRLNNWRFREGYQTGQENYSIGQSERAATPILNASDLLRYIAHRDPDTKRYYFAEDELSSLEDMLGQLVGYLCAALFPQREPAATQERKTEPLPRSAILQEA